MMETIKIFGKQIYLQSLAEQNASQDYCGWLNDSEVNKYLETRETTVEKLKDYIKEKNNNPDCLFLGIFSKNNGKHIGNIKLEPIDKKNKKATLGILIGDKTYWGRGIGTEATKILVDYAFNHLGLDEVNLGVICENKAAIKVYEKAGFKLDRKEKQAVRHNDQLFDRFVMLAKKAKARPLKDQIMGHILSFSFGIAVRGLGQFVNQYLAARLLGPVVFGTWEGAKLVLGYGTLGGLGSLEGMYKEIPVLRGRGKQENIKAITSSSFVFNFFASLILASSIFVVSYFVKMSFEAALSLRFVSLIIFIQFFKVFYEAWLKAHNRFEVISKIAIFDGIGIASSVLLIFLFSFPGFLAGFTLSNLATTLYAYKKSGIRLSFKWNFSVLKNLIAVGFPIMIISLSGILFQTIDRILILKFLNPRALGLYTIGWIAFLPVMFVFYSANSVMFPRFGERFGMTGKDEELKTFVTRPIKVLSSVTAIMIGGIALALPGVVEMFLPAFAEGIGPAQILIFGLFFAYGVGMLGNFFLVTNRQYLYLAVLLSGVLVNLILSAIFLKAGWGIIGVALGASISYLVFFLIMIFLSMIYCGIKGLERARFFIKSFLPLIYVFALVLAINYFFHGNASDIFILVKELIFKETIFLVLSSVLIYFLLKELEIGKNSFKLWKK